MDIVTYLVLTSGIKLMLVWLKVILFPRVVLDRERTKFKPSKGALSVWILTGIEVFPTSTIKP